MRNLACSSVTDFSRLRILLIHLCTGVQMYLSSGVDNASSLDGCEVFHIKRE
jgi:hypothetical protein